MPSGSPLSAKEPCWFDGAIELFLDALQTGLAGKAAAVRPAVDD